jgi:hypothetical protein
MDIGFAIGSIVRLQVPRVRMANGWALGKFAGEFAQGTQTYVGQLQPGLFLRPYFAYTASHPPYYCAHLLAAIWLCRTCRTFVPSLSR